MPDIGTGEYRVETFIKDAYEEKRLFFGSHHFCSIITSGGLMAFRPHPGVDPNGWGSTLYLQPFIADSDPGLALIDYLNAQTNGIAFGASGSIPAGESGTFGGWTLTNGIIAYFATEKRMELSAEYAIQIDGILVNTSGDLNIYRLASNYLYDVPLLSGGRGDTGDIEEVSYTNDYGSDIWNPIALPSHFPGPATDNLTITAVGTFNVVDTLAQTNEFRAIKAAFKPTVVVTLQADEPGYGTIPGFIYDLTKSNLFYEDNIGITPVVPQSSTVTNFSFHIQMKSNALENDGEGIVAELAVETPPSSEWDSMEVYFNDDPSLMPGHRLGGTLYPQTTSLYTGTVYITRAPWENKNLGVIMTVAPYLIGSTNWNIL